MKYRAEIDGLRALAVIPVILFHAGFEVFSGGFVGVDVFFVISGYLITSIIVGELDESNFSLVNFYERRARRILPALFFVVLACIPVAWLVLLPSDMKDFSQSLVAVTTFSSNIFFWLESDYFDTAAELKPLLHTWSLAVEEQYYILFPLLLMATYSSKKTLMFWILVAISILSLAGAHWGAYNAPSATFYLLHTRAWELLIGAFVALYLKKRAYATENGASAQIASFIGLSLIIYSIFAFDKQTPFPSLYTLVPTVGVALIILFAAQGTVANAVLSNRLFVAIGMVSYSAYLWHQPLFAFVRHASFDEPGQLIMLMLCFLTFFFAYISWRYVEKPFRQKGNFTRKTIFASSGVLGLVVIAIGVLGHTQNGYSDYYFSNRISPERAHYISYLEYKNTDNFKDGYRYGSCFYGAETNTFQSFKKDVCLALSDQTANILLVGDSHAAHFAHALSGGLAVNLLQATASGCRPLYPYSGEKRCTDLLQYVYEEFLPSNPVDAIVLSGQWEEDDVVRIEKTIALLSKYAPKLVFIGPTLVYKKDVPIILSGLEQRRISRTHRLLEQGTFSLDEMLRATFSDNYDSAGYISLIDLLCNQNDCDTVTPENIPMVWDKAHFTLEGSELIVNKSGIHSYLFGK